MKHWRTTIAGVFLAGCQTLLALDGYDTLSVKKLVIRFSLAGMTFVLGLLAHDGTTGA